MAQQQNNQPSAGDGQQQAPPPPTRQQQISIARGNVASLLDKYKPQLQAALPGFLTPEKMIRVVLTAATKNPDILLCTQYSLMGSVLTCAQLGLLPDNILGEAYLIPFWNNKIQQKECTVIIGYKGLCALAMRSGQVSIIYGRAVFDGDEFDYMQGTEEWIKHKPCDETDPNKITHFYAVVKMKDGTTGFVVMSRKKVEAVRDASANYAGSKDKASSVWGKRFEEMGLKTAVRRVLRTTPLSPEVSKAIAVDEAAEMGDQKPHVEFMEDLKDMTEDIDHELVNEAEAAAAAEKDAEAAATKTKADEALKATMDKMAKKS